MNAVVYARQSKDREGDGLAVSRQMEDCERLAELRGWTVISRHVDNDISAKGHRERPGFDAVLDAIATGRATIVVAWALDRLTRNRRDTVRLIETCQKAGATVALVRGTDLDMSTPSGRMVADLLAAVARGEIEVKSDRQKRAAVQAAERGLPYGGRRPFGYEDDKVTIRRDEADGLEAAYEAVLGGMSLAGAARLLNARGLTTAQHRHSYDHGCPEDAPCGYAARDCPQRQGKPSPWTAGALRFTLLNPRYAGMRARSVRPEHRRWEWEVIGPAAWDPIVDLEVYEAVKTILTDPDRRTPPRSARAMLSGVALCGICGQSVHGGRNIFGHKTYRCKANHICRGQDPVNEYVGRIVCERLSRSDAVDLMMPTVTDMTAARAELVDKRRRLARAPKVWAAGDFSDEQLVEVKRELGARIAELEAQLGDSAMVELLRPLIMADDIGSVWSDEVDDRRRAVVDALMVVRLLPPGRGTRTFRPDTVQIEWHR